MVLTPVGMTWWLLLRSPCHGLMNGEVAGGGRGREWWEAAACLIVDLIKTRLWMCFIHSRSSMTTRPPEAALVSMLGLWLSLGPGP